MQTTRDGRGGPEGLNGQWGTRSIRDVIALKFDNLSKNGPRLMLPARGPQMYLGVLWAVLPSPLGGPRFLQGFGGLAACARLVATSAFDSTVARPVQQKHLTRPGLGSSTASDAHLLRDPLPLRRGEPLTDWICHFSRCETRPISQPSHLSGRLGHPPASSSR